MTIKGKMYTDKKTARIVGVLFITATVTAILSLVFIGPILDAPDYLINVSTNENQMFHRWVKGPFIPDHTFSVSFYMKLV